MQEQSNSKKHLNNLIIVPDGKAGTVAEKVEFDISSVPPACERDKELLLENLGLYGLKDKTHLNLNKLTPYERELLFYDMFFSNYKDV